LADTQQNTGTTYCIETYSMKARKANWLLSINRKEFLDYLGFELGYQTLEKFYCIPKKKIREYGGAALLDNLYQGSLVELLQDVYCYHTWFPWNFVQNVQNGYWSNTKNQRDFMDQLGQELNYKHMDDWYNITIKQISEKKGGITLLTKYGFSPSKLVTCVYSEQKWNFLNFNTVHRYWDNKTNQKNFLILLGKGLKLKNMDGWYEVTKKQILGKKGGASLMKKYGDSPAKLIISNFSDHSWNISKFNTHKIKKGYWDIKDNQRNFMDSIGKEFGIKIMEDWYKITKKQIVESKGGHLLTKYSGSPIKLLKAVYSEHKWEGLVTT
jgi:hypothetical protein